MEIESALAYTVSHFKEVARQNRFAENGTIEHDRSRCVVCNPDIGGREPFLAYLEVVVESVLVRRPKVDRGLVAEINSDREMNGQPADVSAARLLDGDPDAVGSWTAWVREALDTGLGLLSIHGPESLEFDLEEQENMGHGPSIEAAIKYIMANQMKGADRSIP